MQSLDEDLITCRLDRARALPFQNSCAVDACIPLGARADVKHFLQGRTERSPWFGDAVIEDQGLLILPEEREDARTRVTKDDRFKNDGKGSPTLRQLGIEPLFERLRQAPESLVGI